MIEKNYHQIVKHYEQCFKQYGDTHRGVDWPNVDDANKRYRIMLEVIREHGINKSLLDVGCGCGHLLEYINAHQNDVDYTGLDISSMFIDLCRKKFPSGQWYCEDLLVSSDVLPCFDYIVMNGVFTEKRELSYEEMLDYVKRFLKIAFSKANIGIAFNVMSKYVDWERSDLFHVPTDEIIDFVTKNLSRHIIVRNDYGLYEYTVYVYKTPSIF